MIVPESGKSWALPLGPPLGPPPLPVRCSLAHSAALQGFVKTGVPRARKRKESNGYHATGIFGYGWSYTEILSVTLEVLRPFVTITHRRTSFFLNQDVPTESYILIPFNWHFGRRKTKVESQLASLQCQNLAQRIQTHGGLHHSIATGESTIVLPCRAPSWSLRSRRPRLRPKAARLPGPISPVGGT